jgi:5'-nucleotidase
MTMTKYNTQTNQFYTYIYRYWLNGKRGPSSHGILNSSSLVSDEFKAKSEVLYNKYYPIEISKNIPLKEKIQAMIDW